MQDQQGSPGPSTKTFLTVAELIALLLQQEQDAIVFGVAGDMEYPTKITVVERCDDGDVYVGW